VERLQYRGGVSSSGEFRCDADDADAEGRKRKRKKDGRERPPKTCFLVEISTPTNPSMSLPLLRPVLPSLFSLAVAL
jgi:hypothetical protein